jgi:hypothetical protein
MSSSKGRSDSGLAIVMEAGNADEQSDMAIAQEVAAVLNKHYPDYLWHIQVQGGGLVLRNHSISCVASAFLRREGFAYLMPRDKMSTPRQIVESAVNAGGSMLELFGLPRGRAPIPDPDALAASGLVKIPADWRVKQHRNFA